MCCCCNTDAVVDDAVTFVLVLVGVEVLWMRLQTDVPRVHTHAKRPHTHVKDPLSMSDFGTLWRQRKKQQKAREAQTVRSERHIKPVNNNDDDHDDDDDDNGDDDDRICNADNTKSFTQAYQILATRYSPVCTRRPKESNVLFFTGSEVSQSQNRRQTPPKSPAGSLENIQI